LRLSIKLKSKRGEPGTSSGVTLSMEDKKEAPKEQTDAAAG
jgi:hypothetical protein